jgi:threonine aldolase
LALERRVASLLGKEAALYVPSGTMANQLAIRVHTRPGDEVISHAGAHLYNYESGAQAALAGIAIRPIASGDGSLPLEQVRASLHLSDDPHFAPTSLICFENTHNGCGGAVVPPENVTAVAALARAHDIALHLDGARLMNAAEAAGETPASLAMPFDTVSICLSKGLGAPVGSVLAGPHREITQALRFRKMYGGAMRQAGVLAAAGLYALDHHVERLRDDHRRARRLAEALAVTPGYLIDLAQVQTNLIYFDLDPNHGLGRAGGSALVVRLAEEGIFITGGAHRLRAVTHLDVDDDGLDRAIASFRRVAAANG